MNWFHSVQMQALLTWITCILFKEGQHVIIINVSLYPRKTGRYIFEH